MTNRIWWRRLRPRPRFVLGLWLLTLISCTPSTPPHALPGHVTVDILDVGQGDAILIRSPEGKTALVDAGPSSRIVSQLRKQGLHTLDAAIVTHHHADHYGGMDDVLRAFRPRLFLTTNSSHTSEPYLKLLRQVGMMGVPVISPTHEPRKLELGTVLITLFPQAPEDLNNENNNSLGLRVQYGEFSVLLTGDAESGERLWWERMVPDLCRNATVLKLAHHGSHNGTDERWLDLVRPRAAVVSLGKNNDFGHPHRATLNLLANAGIRLFRTDQDGRITLRSDGQRWQVFTHPESSLDWSFPVKRIPGGWGRPPRVKLPPSFWSRININKASRTQLRKIPGVGRALADRIVKGRPYRSVDDLIKVRGIGERSLEEMRPYIRIK